MLFLRYATIIIVGTILWIPLNSQGFPSVDHNKLIIPLHLKYTWQSSLRLGLFLPARIPKTSAHTWISIDLLPFSPNLGLGYRQLINQKWFIGGYGNWHYIEAPIAQVLTIKRGSIGIEVAHAQLGQMTINLYRYFAFPQEKLVRYRLIKDIQGASLTCLGNISRPTKVFLSGAYTHVGCRKRHAKAFNKESVVSLATGVHWIINRWTDLEIKLAFGKYSPLFHMNFQIKLDGNNNQGSPFQNRLHQPPKAYMPYYATSNTLEADS